MHRGNLDHPAQACSAAAPTCVGGATERFAPANMVAMAGLGDESVPTLEVLLEDYRRRMMELTALYETAGDLSSLRDVNDVLSAIVRRSRQLLTSDIAYLMLNDEERHDTFMRVTEGTQTEEFMSVRLGPGEGLGGLIVRTGVPQWTSDYENDPRFAESAGASIRRESIKAILGVPLMIGSRVIGVLFAGDRSGREYLHREIALLSSLAHHAAIALENASLFEESQNAMEQVRAANARIETQNRILERAADLHERLTQLAVSNESLDQVAEAVADSLGGRVWILDANKLLLTTDLSDYGSPIPPLPDVADDTTVHDIGEDGVARYIAPVRAGNSRLGSLVYSGEVLGEADVRTLERAALVTALLLLDKRVHDESRVRWLNAAFNELLDNRAPDIGELRRHARSRGISFPEPPFDAFVAITSTATLAPHVFGQVATSVMATRVGLVRVDAGAVTMILQSANLDKMAKELAKEFTAGTGQPVTVGGVGPFDDLREAATSHVRALECAQVLVAVGREGEGATPEQLGLYTLLLSEVGRDRIELFVWETLGVVQDYDETHGTELMATLQAYFDGAGQTGSVAKSLFIHTNTLYQRLERIDRLIGQGWRQGDQGLETHLATQLARLLNDHVRTPTLLRKGSKSPH